MSEEIYRKMGKVHTDKDEMIRMKDVEEIEKQVNGHCTFWCKMWKSGEMHGHKDRIIDSKMCRSCKVASMYLLVKDHKKDGSTRPVVTGCSSNTRGMSNAVSDFLESPSLMHMKSYHQKICWQEWKMQMKRLERL